jgi:hypothetical protein
MGFSSDEGSPVIEEILCYAQDDVLLLTYSGTERSSSKKVT